MSQTNLYEPPALSQIIQNINKKFALEIKQVDALILGIATRENLPLPELLTKAATHIISAGGKRLRPLLTLITAEICRLKDAKQCLMGAAIELLHTATLLHDDVVDASKTRRNMASANALWGNKASILVGDYLLGNAFDLMVQAGSLPALSMLASTAKQMSEAEVLQLQVSHNFAITLPEYIRIITGKTASLFGAACAVSAYLRVDEGNYVSQGNSPSAAELFYEFGSNIGIIYQIVDDYLDYCASANELGKPIWNDFTEKKITFPIIALKSKLKPAELSLLAQIFDSNELLEAHSHESNDHLLRNLITAHQGESANPVASSLDLTSSATEQLKFWLKEYDIKKSCVDFLQKYLDKATDALDKIAQTYNFIDHSSLMLLKQLAPALCQKVYETKLD